ncbi:MAG TPA: HEAT repeat domain-containing protein [Thermoanaerobaculia bacterium]|jgi:HEAT repeat protein|nr:HEAT repeat domain-containing protein [Thermoanaerobaculia bacterium]HPA50500.1 HEAT repeat domain-containing protein [Thermoanaerobaculia bacterium]HQN07061.1 HEAT repeat domain-containing protein [Thermoanaerobaculia bacterium]HQP85182.1 HEAT repeat domain-containing protein [Thermoanaerobaculia bacterium]
MSDDRIRELAARAASKDATERWTVAGELGRIPGEEAESVLLALLKDEDYRVRERAVAALGRRFTPRVASACAVALADDDDAGHRAAGLALLVRGGAAGRAVLLGALQHPSADVRISAAAALPGPAPGPETVTAIEAAARREGDPNARAALLLALGRTGRREAIAPLLAALEEGNLWLQVHALEALGDVGDPEIAPRILPLLTNANLRHGALHALARLRSPVAGEPLLRRAAAGEVDVFLVAALRAALESASATTLAGLRPLWPEAGPTLLALLEDPEEDAALRTDAAHVLALLDLPGAALAIVTHGPFRDGYAALRALPRARREEALLCVLQVADPEPALELLDAHRGGPEAPTLLPLLVHPSATVKAAVLSCVPAGLVPIPDLIDVLAEDDPETALAAALALASDDSGEPLDRLPKRRRALLDRAGGPDGPGRVAALAALAGTDGPDVEAAVRGALSTPDPAVREAAVTAAARGRRIGSHEIVACLSDEIATVRAAALRGLALRAERGEALPGVTWRDGLVFLVDDPAAAAAAGAAVIALAGAERPRLVEEMLVQEPAVRIAALEEIEKTGDPEAARSAVAALGHEDPETACAAVRALSVADEAVAAEALATALADERAEVRAAAAETVARRPPGDSRSALSGAVATALVVESDRAVLRSLLVAASGLADEAMVDPMTLVLSQESIPAEADDAAEALARLAPEACRRAWMQAPARAERRWARALATAARAGRSQRST